MQYSSRVLLVDIFNPPFTRGGLDVISYLTPCPNIGDHYMDRAIADYGKAIELQPNSVEAAADAYTGRGLVYQHLGNPDQAIADHNKAIELQPNSAEAYNNRGLAHLSIPDLDSAIKDFSKAIELNPDYTVTYSNRGAIYRMRGNSDLADADFRTAEELRGAS